MPKWSSGNRGGGRSIIGGGADIHTFVLCIINFFWNRLCLQSVHHRPVPYCLLNHWNWFAMVLSSVINGTNSTNFFSDFFEMNILHINFLIYRVMWNVRHSMPAWPARLLHPKLTQRVSAWLVACLVMMVMNWLNCIRKGITLGDSVLFGQSLCA